ncbi:hypothetical protein PLICRDRAFT_169848 [Plicaturopsis crispa FD-325 SS-3]|nr:hypothetical protein PLICRDRAFT_169848 [Plicaturopsis crispa FD-325 SS-3]
MAKRKAAPSDAQPPAKRRTRSSGLLQDTQPAPAPVTRTRSAVKKTTPKVLRTYGSKTSAPARAKRVQSPQPDTTSLKENDHVDPSDDEDELNQNLSPSKRPPPRPSTPVRNAATRTFLHSVEISTPSRHASKLPIRHSGSPTPARRPKVRVAEPVTPAPALSTPKKALSTPKPSPSKKRAPPVPIPLPSNSTITRIPPSPPRTPSRKEPTNPFVTPSKTKVVASPSKSTAQLSPSRLPRGGLPPHLIPCLNAQKRAVLAALQDPPEVPEPEGGDDEDEQSTNAIAFQELSALLQGTVSRGEGNSCLLLGPRGSGKTRMVERCLADLEASPIVIRLSGWALQNDRLAMREIARQLSNQTGTSYLTDEDDEAEAEEANPFVENTPNLSMPPPSHLPALISVLPTLSRPTVVVLDAFDLFAEHPRQSLLYCLLDTVQSCRGSGLAVIGVTTRVDTINLLEKRVKSRFSGRMLRTAGPDDWAAIARAAMCVPIAVEDPAEEWAAMWEGAVETFLGDKAAVAALAETFSLTRDVRALTRILVPPILELKPSAPFPSASRLASCVATQRIRPAFPFLHTLPYPAICLLIAYMHADTAGHDVVTFEQLHACVHDHVRASMSAPVRSGGGSIGMVRCARPVLMSAFENLVSARYFVAAAPASAAIAREFVRYRCVVERADVKTAVETMGHTNLKKWFSKAQ